MTGKIPRNRATAAALRSFATAALLLLVAGEAVAESRGRVVAGRAERIEGPVAGDAVLLGAETVVAGRIEGDLLAWGGRLRLEPTAEITGSVLLVGTLYETSPGARVRGRVLFWASLEEVGRAVIAGEGNVPVETFRRWMWGLRLGSLAAWLVAALVVSTLLRAPVERLAEIVRAGLVVPFFSGLALFLGFVLAAWGDFALPWGTVGLPLVVLLAAAAIAAKIFGLSAVFVATGRWIARLRGAATPPPSPVAVTTGLLLLGGVRLVPFVGDPVWVAASLVGFGVVAGGLFSRPSRG